MPRFNENRVEARRCPECGTLRPHDWFIPADAACWKCRSLRPKTDDDDIEAIKRNIENERGVKKKCHLK